MSNNAIPTLTNENVDLVIHVETTWLARARMADRQGRGGWAHSHHLGRVRDLADKLKSKGWLTAERAEALAIAECGR